MQKSKDLSVQCTENRILHDDNISCPSDVEVSGVVLWNAVEIYTFIEQIIKKNTDPKRDVFVLKIGKDAANQNGIQLEMRTPKNPFASTSSNKLSNTTQTFDDEFVSQVKKTGKVSSTKKAGKKGGKKK